MQNAVAPIGHEIPQPHFLRIPYTLPAAISSTYLHNAVVSAETLSAPHRPPVAGLGHVLRLTYGIPDLH